MFYSISRSKNIDEIGYYPQADFREGYNPRKNGHFMVKHYEFPDFRPNLELEINPKANPTNYLDSTAGLMNGFILDKKLKDILSISKLPKHHFYPIKVFQTNNLLDYYWFHYIIDDFWEYLDKDKSSIEVVYMESPTKITVETTMPIISNEQIISCKKNLSIGKNLRIRELIMKPSFPKYDFYKIGCLSRNTLISESLKDIIFKEGITGIEIKPFNKFLISE